MFCTSNGFSRTSELLRIAHQQQQALRDRRRRGVVPRDQQLLEDRERLGHVERPLAVQARAHQIRDDVLARRRARRIDAGCEVVLELEDAARGLERVLARREARELCREAVGPALELRQIRAGRPTDPRSP
jgi:hypothetical protein